MTVAEARRNPCLRRYSLRRHRLSTARGTLSIVAPTGCDDLLEGAVLERCLCGEELPYWADVWPASVGLARLLLRGPSLSGRRVLDLGCGVGVAGSAAASHGATVTFADLHEDALAFALFNAKANGGQVVAVHKLDWQRSTTPGRHDLLLLADVSYQEDHHRPLVRHLDRSLSPGGEAWQVDPFRAASTTFLEGLQARFSVRVETIDTFFNGVRVPLRLARIARL